MVIDILHSVRSVGAEDFTATVVTHIMSNRRRSIFAAAMQQERTIPELGFYFICL